VNIYDPYPEEVELDGKIYPLNLSYDRVLMMLDIQDDKTLTTADKLETQCVLILENGYKDLPMTIDGRQKLLKAVLDLLPKKEDRQAKEKYIDFHQDAAMIRTAFFRIGVDLLKDKIHIFQFLELLADLPSDTALMRTVEIRQRPIPKPTKHNGEQIAALQKAKERVAIKMSEEERRELFAQSLKNASILRG
jgi:hypothetical protein